LAWGFGQLELARVLELFKFLVISLRTKLIKPEIRIPLKLLKTRLYVTSQAVL